MAQAQRKIKPDQKRALFAEAGSKCANPGCSNWRAHIHHIKHWAVYRTHDARHMIAVCPSCHDACHYGRLKISDDALYLWKGIVRRAEPEAVLVYVEPSAELKLLTGSLAIATVNDQLAVFELSNSNHLKLRILDGDILQVSVRLTDLKGKELLRVVENHVRVNRRNSVQFDYRPGHVRITVPASGEYAPGWLLDHMRAHEPDYAADGRIVALEIEVLRPGLVRVQGCWPDRDVGVVITMRAMSFCDQTLIRPISMVGHGETTVLNYKGPVTTSMFGFRGRQSSAIRI